eukprot:7074989-Pyramimonas_sp.AAC.2
MSAGALTATSAASASKSWTRRAFRRLRKYVDDVAGRPLCARRVTRGRSPQTSTTACSRTRRTAAAKQYANRAMKMDAPSGIARGIRARTVGREDI